jgi:hypothetical protein
MTMVEEVSLEEIASQGFPRFSVTEDVLGAGVAEKFDWTVIPTGDAMQFGLR